MDESLTKVVELVCPACDATAFELRASSDEGIASARCTQCDRTYLLLDSEDFWIDAIQTSSPRIRRCSCKSTALQLKLDYFFRDDNEVKMVDLRSQCLNCQKSKRQLSVKIDYAPTDDLVVRPLRYCEHPQLRYDLKQISLYVSKVDIVSIIRYLVVQGEARVIARLWGDESLVLRPLDLDEVQTLVLTGRFLSIYVSFCETNWTSLDIGTSKREDAFWKRHEVIRLGSPTHMMFGSELGLLGTYSSQTISSRMVPLFKSGPIFAKRPAPCFDG